MFFFTWMATSHDTSQLLFSLQPNKLRLKSTLFELIIFLTNESYLQWTDTHRLELLSDKGWHYKLWSLCPHSLIPIFSQIKRWEIFHQSSKQLKKKIMSKKTNNLFRQFLRFVSSISHCSHVNTKTILM